jgi:hypothetical protein
LKFLRAHLFKTITVPVYIAVMTLLSLVSLSTEKKET